MHIPLPCKRKRTRIEKLSFVQQSYMNSDHFARLGIPPITHPRLIMTTYHNFVATYSDNLKGWNHNGTAMFDSLADWHSAGIFTVRQNWLGFWKFSIFNTRVCLYAPSSTTGGECNWPSNVALVISRLQLIWSGPSLQICPVVDMVILLFL